MSCKHEKSSSQSKGKAADHELLGPKTTPASNLPTRPHLSGVRLPEDAAVTKICPPASGAEAALRDTIGRAAAGMDSDVAASQQGPVPGNGSLTIVMDHLAGVSAGLHLSTGKKVSACHPDEDKLLDSVRAEVCTAVDAALVCKAGGMVIQQLQPAGLVRYSCSM